MSASPAPFSKCGACTVGIGLISKKRDLGPTPVEKATGNEVDKGSVVLDVLRVIAYTWGSGGVLRVAEKYVERKPIQRRDLLHVILPFAGAGIIEDLQRPKMAGGQSAQPSPLIGVQPQGMSHELKKTPEMKGEGKLDAKPLHSPVIPSVPKQIPSLEELRESIRKLGEQVKLPRDEDREAPRSLEDPWALRWRGILSRYPRILILGAQGTGKSCLAYWLLEILHHRCRCFAYGLPGEGASYIPSWLGVIHDLSDAPPGSIVLVDEAYLVLFSRESLTRKNSEFVRLLNLARQKNLGFIFVAHEARHIDKNVLSSVDTLIMKRPAPLQLELDRSFLRPYLIKAQRVFEGKNQTQSKRISYLCFTPSDFEGVLENPQPSFWSERLSHAFSSGNVGIELKPGRELSKEERMERAKELQDSGYSYGQIAKALGVGKTTAYRWLNPEKNSGTEE